MLFFLKKSHNHKNRLSTLLLVLLAAFCLLQLFREATSTYVAMNDNNKNKIDSPSGWAAAAVNENEADNENESPPSPSSPFSSWLERQEGSPPLPFGSCKSTLSSLALGGAFPWETETSSETSEEGASAPTPQRDDVRNTSDDNTSPGKPAAEYHQSSSSIQQAASDKAEDPVAFLALSLPVAPTTKPGPRSLPYKTKEEYMQRLVECMRDGKEETIDLLDGTTGLFRRHPSSNELYAFHEAGNWTLMTKSISTTCPSGWKINLHEGMYANAWSHTYKQLLDGELNNYRGTAKTAEDCPAESNAHGFITVLNNKYVMSNGDGSNHMRENFWKTEARKNPYKQWKKEQKKLQAKAAKKRSNEATMAEEQETPKKKRRKTNPSTTTTTTIHNSGGYVHVADGGKNIKNVNNNFLFSPESAEMGQMFVQLMTNTGNSSED